MSRQSPPGVQPVAWRDESGASEDVESGGSTAGEEKQRRIIEALLRIGGGETANPWVFAPGRVLRAVLVAKALLLAFCSLAGYPAAPTGAPLPSWVHTAMFWAFSTSGLLLVRGGRTDRRATPLGLAFLLIGAAFARETARHLAAQFAGPEWTPVRLLILLNLDALLPILFWLFAREFPRNAHHAAALERTMLKASIALGMMLVAWDALHLAGLEPVLVDSHGVAKFRVVGLSNWYWLITFGLTLSAFPYVLWRARGVSGAERARTTWFVAGIAFGLFPLLTEVILEVLIPGVREWAAQPTVRPVLGGALAMFLLSVPITTTYAILVKRILELRVALRRAVQCAIAKYAFIALCLCPMLAVYWALLRQRDRAIGDVIDQPAMLVLIGASVTGAVALAFADRALRWVDHAFLRPSYDSRALMAELGPRLSRAANAAAIAEIVARGIDAALKPYSVTVLVEDPGRRGYGAPDATRPVLTSDSALIELVSRLESGHALDVSDRVLRCVDRADAAWLVKVAAELLVPMKGSDGSLIGALALGSRQGDLAYSREDILLISDIAGAAAMAIEKRRLRSLAAVERFVETAPVEQLALECGRCGALYPAGASALCETCGEPLELSVVPFTLSDAFQLRRRIGRGGMGLVYLAVDAALGRTVAVKTLPYVAEAGSHRLRREARAMATVSHPNLATIYAYETWKGRPLLIVEYLEGGTLAERLHDGPRAISDVVGWGLQLCDGLASLHRRGLLHGDIKPSNIGFDRHGVPKLLDFGLSDVLAAAPATHDTTGSAASHRVERFGTPAYRCPHAEELNACPQLDLWGLAAVLYESIAGVRAFDVAVPRTASAAVVPDIRTFRAEVPEALALFFTRALHSDVEARPSSALEFSLWLNEARPIL